MRLPASGYRLHRFPPLAQPAKVDDELGLDNNGWQDNQVDMQERLEAGFQQGLQQGHDEGIRQGLEQGKQQGLLEGQKEGFQKGYVAGEQSGKQTFAEAVKPVNELYQALSRWQSEKEQQQRHIICELVQKVAQQVIRAELTLMPQQILALVDETLGAMPGKTEKVIVHLNPQDLERISQVNADLPDAWQLVANPELPVGGCHLVTDDAEADASCDSRLEACMDNVKQHLLDEVTTPQVEESHDQPL
ncbi:flagellar assembly protein FliH [Vibrio sp. CAU 1672]|uniref:flagellar assembly protein FliH n=1 Tax=Vibrio sp. CAU 1672 TaxID=3032594 RepID=UPI0023DBF7FA|nr:flagellar assembly protein FliH [Vibrio sp. CAU 1672]MDF2152627.1 flagellar assembly protein FliH [Vibrio sp. CAU 1672]